MSKVILGADPEIFVEDTQQNLVPAFLFLPGKDKPMKIGDKQAGYWDGFQGEFTVKPSSNIEEVMTSIKEGLQAINDKAKSYDSKTQLSKDNVFNVSLHYLQTLEHHLVEFGCMPSFNIYNIKGMGADGAVTPYRFAGGHIHFGIGKQTDEVNERIVKSLDTLLAILCVSLFEHVDNPVRRQYYGLVGEYRLPPHGLEYRTLSNAWMQHPKLTKNILELAQKIVEYTLDNKFEFQCTEAEVIETVLTCNVKKARDIINRNKDCYKLLNYEVTLQPINIEETINETWNLK